MSRKDSAHRAGQRDFQTIENPCRAERNHDEPVPGAPRHPVQARWHIRFDRFAVCHSGSLSRKETVDAKQAEAGLTPSANVGDGLPSGRSWFMRWLLVQHFDRIAFMQHAFDHHRTINTRHAFVSLRYFL